MQKKKPFIAMLYLIAIFSLIALISALSGSGITGLYVLGELSSDNSLMILGPIAVFGLLFSAGIIALIKMSRE